MKSNKTGAKHTKRTNIRKIGKFSNPYVNEIGIHHFGDGTEALIFDVGNPNALNQIIGYAKFINADYGNVYYRGETELHSSVLPSIAREAGHQKYEESLNRVIAAAIADEQFTNCAKLSNLSNSKASKLIAEAMLQHYGFSTHFVDVVDNHWIALWFGLNQYATITNLSTYSFYKQRRITPVELLSPQGQSDIYQYMLLIAVDDSVVPLERGVYQGNDTTTIDLRSSLPSVFIRPHAQHGLVIKRNTRSPADSFDLSSHVIAIIRMRIDHVAQWIGTGQLLTSSNLFPSPAFDYGYEILLKRTDLFETAYHHIAQYI